MRVKFVHEVSSGQGQGHWNKNVAKTGSRNDRLRSAIFIGSRRMAPQTTRRGRWGLRLEGALVVRCFTI